MSESYYLKRPLDIFLSFVGLVFSWPLWTLISFLIWLEDGGPIFYLQDRMGKNGKIFKSIKFRSMNPKAEEGIGPIQAKENDQRITRAGKILRATAMDELPQLLNILKGDMSFVGPRPLRPVEKEIHDNSIKRVFDFPEFGLRSKIKPGLTGVAQVFCSRDLIRQKKFKYDIWYIKNQNFLLDFYLIILSVGVTLKAKWEIRRDKFNAFGRGIKKRIEKEIG